MHGEKYTQADLLRRGAEESKKYTDKKTGALAGEIGHINDDLSQLGESIIEISDEVIDKTVLPLPELRIGGITNGGNPNYATDSIRVTAVQYYEKGTIFSLDEGYQIKIFKWKNSAFSSANMKEPIFPEFWHFGDVTLDEDSYIAFALADANFSTNTDTSISSHLSIYKIVSAKKLKDRVSDLEEEIMPLIPTDSPYKRNVVTLKNGYDGWYESKQTFPDATALGRDTKYSDLISMYENLRTRFPERITRRSIGYGSGTDANGNRYEMYEYTFKPKRYNSSKNITNFDGRIMPKIIIGACAHGFEKNSAYATYFLMKDICENWGESTVLADLHRNVEFKVIPVVNPYGFDNNTYANGNGVNINRNYAVDNWVVSGEGTTSYSGAYAMSEPESQNVEKVVLDNLDAILFYDVHTNGQYWSNDYHEANACMPLSNLYDAFYKRIYNVFAESIVDQTYNFEREYEIVRTGSDFFGRIQDGEIVSENAYGYCDTWCTTKHNIIAFTFELFNGLTTPNDGNKFPVLGSESKKVCTEILGNSIAKMLKEFAS